MCVTAVKVYPDHFVYPIRLAERLPGVPVPLNEGGPPMVVEWQPLIDRCYDAGRYGMVAEYHRPCDPPLSAEQAAWAVGVLAARGGAGASGNKAFTRDRRRIRQRPAALGRLPGRAE